ncbi:MAG: hypothetical protein KJ947_11185 [Alphaproteobacteria bacterium]|nr:hypothetical protein [Alphaproteobacteria bacterium]MBU1550120.1 hypothetical protein [Alphaproteobacteria bacterium]MBU2337078.1 hypothetical protein [Alphaproteobacteria bacterium]MBU2389409.1 hypothetical protein [Alphaproteobacteria bacterium]
MATEEDIETVLIDGDDDISAEELADLLARFESDAFEPPEDDLACMVMRDVERRSIVACRLAADLNDAFRMKIEDALQDLDFTRKAVRWPSEAEIETLSQRITEDLFDRITIPAEASGEGDLTLEVLTRR